VRFAKTLMKSRERSVALKKISREVKYLAEGVGDFQPGSRKRVLRNKLNIVRVRDIEDAELAAYLKAEQVLIGKYTADHTFAVEDIDHIHRLFLGDIYEWAGRYRNVNLSKRSFPFASAMAIPQSMREFERRILGKHTPCRGETVDAIAEPIAIVHVEFLLIHPYREGNGRTARLLATLMAYQAGMPGLDFGFIGSRGGEFDRYVAAIHAGLSENYRPMATIMRRAITRALRKAR
jgi:cell filamentation protein